MRVLATIVFVSDPSRELTSLQRIHIGGLGRRDLVSDPSRELTSLQLDELKADLLAVNQVSDPSRELTSLQPNFQDPGSDCFCHVSDPSRKLTSLQRPSGVCRTIAL